MSEPTKLLVVEDDPEISAALATYARSRGYDVRIAENGKRAIDEVAGDRPDVILLDISLPYVDGRDLLVRWRSEGVTAKTVVIFVTARDEQTDRLVGLELGADDYETKPLQFFMLFQKIAHLLAKKRAAIAD